MSEHTPSGRPVSPHDYLPIAREMLKHREEFATAIQADRESDIAGTDQRDAAARDARRNMERTLEDLESLGIQPTSGDATLNAKTLAWNLAAAGAITRRIPDDRKCPHAGPAARRPLVASLTSRWMLCRECAPRLAPRFALSGVAGTGEDDGHCDVCDREATQFSEFQVTVGPLQLTGNICSLCRFWMDGARR